MGGIKHAARDIGAVRHERLPWQRKTQRENLALLVATMLSERNANLMSLAAALPRRSDRIDMRYQWIVRVLANLLIECDAVMLPDRATAEAAIATFADKYGAKYDKAVTGLVKDRDALLTFYDFPAEHWDHLRTSNPIESVFATVRHRTVRTKGALSQDTARLMVFKLVTAAKTWRRLKGESQLPKVVQGVTFTNGVEVTNTPAQNAA